MFTTRSSFLLSGSFEISLVVLLELDLLVGLHVSIMAAVFLLEITVKLVYILLLIYKQLNELHFCVRRNG